MSQLSDLPFLDVRSEIPPAHVLEDRALLENFENDQLNVLQRAIADSWIYRSQRGVEILSYEPQWSILRDRRLGQDQARTARDSGLQHPDVLRFRSEFLNATTGMTHARLRSTIAPSFGKPYVETMRSTIRGFIDSLLDLVAAGSTVDLFKLVCEHVPSMTYAHLVRAPESDEPFIARMSESILKLIERDPKNRDVIESAYTELFEYTEERFAVVEKEPSDDLISNLIRTVGEGKLTRREAMDLSILLLEASTDNTMHEMALVVSALLDEPAQWDEITKDQSLIPQAVE
jgi:cytochrome P450